MGLIRMERRGVQKIIYSGKTPEELFAAAREYLSNPVKRTIYVPKSESNKKLLMSGCSALSEYSMLNPPMVCHLAADSIAAWEKFALRGERDESLYRKNGDRKGQKKRTAE